VVFHIEDYHDVQSTQLMVQFIFNRFQTVEIVVEQNDRHILSALELISATEHGNLSNEIYISYPPKRKGEYERILQLQSQFQNKDLPFIKGIHVDLSAFEGKSTRSELLKQDPIQAIYETKNSSEIDLGVLVNTSLCLDIIHHLVDGKPMEPSILKAFQDADYLLCRDEINQTERDSKVFLSDLFDTHLYIKRVFLELQPRLNIFFRVELNADVTRNSIGSYLTFLSHFKKFGAAYNITYIIVEGFDRKTSQFKNGWWAIETDADLTNPKTYTEKEPGSFNRKIF